MNQTDETMTSRNNENKHAQSSLFEKLISVPALIVSIVIFLSVVIGLFGAVKFINSKLNPPPPPKLMPFEPWASLPREQWPQIVLTNDAKFIGHTPLRGASSFLFKTDDQNIYAGTAKHLIHEAGGVKPDVFIDSFDKSLRFWKMHPRTVLDRFVEVDKLASGAFDNSKQDWLALTLKKSDNPFPAMPLLIRPNPVTIGEKIFLIGCQYSDADCIQNVYKATVTGRAGDHFKYDFDTSVELRGFSGAPLVDNRGHLVGVMTVWFNAKIIGEKYLEGGGEDAATLLEIMK